MSVRAPAVWTLLASVIATAACGGDVRSAASRGSPSAEAPVTAGPSVSASKRPSASPRRSVAPAPPDTPDEPAPSRRPRPAATPLWPVDVAVSADGTGWVLGASCRSLGCPATLARTTDAGRSWQRRTPPAADVTDNGARTGVLQLEFADSTNGWAWGPDLHATHDAGRSWQEVELGRVVAVEAAAGTVWAVVETCRGGDECGYTVHVSPVHENRFTAGTSLYIDRGPVTLMRAGATHGWVVNDAASGEERFLATEDAGASWAPRVDPCPAETVAWSAAAVDAATVVAACSTNGSGGTVGTAAYTSADGGRTWGTPRALAVPGGAFQLASNGGAALLLSLGDGGMQRSTDAGETWTTAVPAGRGRVERVDVAGQHGLATGTGRVIWVTRDGGREWRRREVA